MKLSPIETIAVLGEPGAAAAGAACASRAAAATTDNPHPSLRTAFLLPGGAPRRHRGASKAQARARVKGARANSYEVR